jgi:hypothetical protein
MNYNGYMDLKVCILRPVYCADRKIYRPTMFEGWLCLILQAKKEHGM